MFSDCLMRKPRLAAAAMAPACVVLSLGLLTGGCNNSAPAPVDTGELTRLQQENREVQRLKRENAELDRLRRDRDEARRLRGTVPGELAKLREENQSLRAQLAAAGQQAPPPEQLAALPEETPELQPIANLPQAFAQAAAALVGVETREEDIPMEGDTIQIDQSVIGLLIPDFAKNTNGGPYEISGWLQSQGVRLENYQQFHVLGITNYKVLRAPPKTQ